MPFMIIVGAGPGISRSVAHRFGKEGFTIGLIARKPQHLEDLKQELNASGISADYRTADATQAQVLAKSMNELIDQHGFPSIALFNASAIHVQDVLEVNWNVMRDGFETCVAGAFHMARQLLPAMLEKNYGKLFFTGGGTALQGEPMISSLSVGKAGMRNLVQALARRCNGTQVHVAQLTVCGRVDPKDSKYAPDLIAQMYWQLYQQSPGEFEQEVIY